MPSAEQAKDVTVPGEGLPAEQIDADTPPSGTGCVECTGEDWFWDFVSRSFLQGGPTLAPPTSHPEDQPAPGPRGSVPEDWLELLHARTAAESAR